MILTSPDGERLTHAVAERLSRAQSWCCCAAGTKASTSGCEPHLATETMSIGDYVLSGGELPALVIVDAVARLVPGVVGDEASVARDTFARGLLDYPQYTRPAEFRGLGCRPCCCRGTTRRSRSGGGVKRSSARSSVGRI